MTEMKVASNGLFNSLNQLYEDEWIGKETIGSLRQVSCFYVLYYLPYWIYFIMRYEVYFTRALALKAL